MHPEETGQRDASDGGPFSMSEVETDHASREDEIDACDICMHCTLLRLIEEKGTDAVSPKEACS